MQRICVTGDSGSGKSTLAKALAEGLGFPYLELDSLYHQPNWTPLESGEFRERVRAFAEQPRWVIDGNYSKVRDLTWPRADTLVLIDLSRWAVLCQLLPRTLGRMFGRKRLWNGNRESPWSLFSPSTDKNILLYSLLTHGKSRRRFLEAQSDPALQHLSFRHLSAPRLEQLL